MSELDSVIGAEWVLVGESRPAEDRETYQRATTLRRTARAFAWLLYVPTRWGCALVMWVSVRQLVALDDGPRLAVESPAPMPVTCPAARWWRTWVVCVPHNGSNVAGFDVRRLGMT